MRFASSFPAVLAALVMALLPSCAMCRPPAGPIEKPHIVRRVAPRDSEAPRIERVAGEHNADNGSFDWSYLAGGLLFALIMWLLGHLLGFYDGASVEAPADKGDDSMVERARRSAARSP